MLGWFALQFAGGREVRHVSKVYAHGIAAQFPLQLMDAFDVGERLDVAHRTANLGNHEVILVFRAHQLHVAFDFIGDMRNYLYGLAQVVATALLVNDSFIYASAGDVVGLGSFDAEKTLVVTEVKVCHVSINRHVALAMLMGVQCTRVNVDVRVELLDGYVVATCLQQLSDRC